MDELDINLKKYIVYIVFVYGITPNKCLTTVGEFSVFLSKFQNSNGSFY